MAETATVKFFDSDIILQRFSILFFSTSSQLSFWLILLVYYFCPLCLRARPSRDLCFLCRRFPPVLEYMQMLSCGTSRGAFFSLLPRYNLAPTPSISFSSPIRLLPSLCVLPFFSYYFGKKRIIGKKRNKNKNRY